MTPSAESKVVYQCTRCGNVFDLCALKCPSCDKPSPWAKLVDEDEIFKTHSHREYDPEGKLNKLCGEISEWAHEKGFNEGVWGNMFFQLMRIVNECSECSEAYRRLSSVAVNRLQLYGLESYRMQFAADDADAQDIHNIEEEMADISIVLFALAHDLGLNLEDLVRRKMQVNETRPHKHGKRC